VGRTRVGFKQFSLLIDSTADAAFAVDTTGRISAWNNAAAELFGLSEAEAIRVSCHNILQCTTDDGLAVSDNCTIAQTAQANHPLSNFDLRLQTKFGRLWCNLSTLLVRDSASGARHTIYIVRPVEIRKRLEQALSEFVRMKESAGLNGHPMVSSTPATDVNGRLTAREKEVLKRLAKGNSTRTIANQLNISSATVNNHIKHILTKLDAHTRLEAIRHAESAGII
jgi:PAS domain S-box-containing protein